MIKMCLPQMLHWRIIIFSAILALTGLFCAPHLNAEIYQWVDENGVKHYSNAPPTDAGNVTIMGHEYRYDEAADQKRVKADQKKIDAFTEKNKREGTRQKQTTSRAGDTPAGNSCYLKATVDVRVIVWPVDMRGNKGEKIWEGIIKKGERKLIRTPNGRIRYASRRNLDDDQLFSGDKSRWCNKGQEIGVP